MTARCPRTLRLLLVLLLLAGCGGGGGGAPGDDQLPPDPDPTPTPPTARILFPPTASRTDAPTLTVTGTADGESGVARVLVNGVQATSTDGFATWRVEIPLVPGLNTIEAQAEDAAGNVGPASVEHRVTRAPAIADAAGIALDVQGRRLFVSDAATLSLYVVDIDTKVVQLVSGPGRGAGNDLERPGPIAYDPVRDRVWMLDKGGEDAVVGIDPTTGDRAAIWIQPVGFLRDLAYDAASDRLVLVGEWFTWMVATLELDVGSVPEVIASPSDGTGPSLAAAIHVYVPPSDHHAFVSIDGIAGEAILAVDLVTGDRTEFSGPSRGTGPSLLSPRGIVERNNDLLVWDEGRKTLFEISGGGDRHVIADGATGTGLPLDSVAALVYDPAVGILVAESRSRLLREVDPDDGDRAAWLSTAVGDARAFVPAALAHGGRQGLLALVEDLYGSPADPAGILRLDPDTGATSHQATDFIANANLLVDIAYDAVRQRLFLVRGIGAPEDVGVFALALEDGASFPISTASHGTGAPLEAPGRLARDPATGRLLVIDFGALRVVDVHAGTGARSTAYEVATVARMPHAVALVTGGDLAFTATQETFDRFDLTTLPSIPEEVSGGPMSVAWSYPTALALDPGNEWAFVVSWEDRALFAVHVPTGQVSIPSSNDVGSGPWFLRPNDVAVDSDRGILYVSDQGWNGILAVEPVSGHRVLVLR